MKRLLIAATAVALLFVGCNKKAAEATPAPATEAKTEAAAPKKDDCKTKCDSTAKAKCDSEVKAKCDSTVKVKCDSLKAAGEKCSTEKRDSLTAAVAAEPKEKHGKSCKH